MPSSIVPFASYIEVQALDQEDALDKAYGPIHRAILPIRERGFDIVWALGLAEDHEDCWSVEFAGEIRVVAPSADQAHERAVEILTEALANISWDGAQTGPVLIAA